MFCPSCGKQIQDGIAFCPFCGHGLPQNSFQPPRQSSPQTYQTPPPPPYQTDKKNSHIARNAVIGFILAIVLIAIILIVFVPGIIPGVSIPGGKPAFVTVAGTVTTTGTGTNPEKITFTSETNGNTYVAACAGGGNPGSYTISLPNGDTYRVTIAWQFIGITGGNANAGTLNLNTFSDNMSMNWSG
jgi:hypothetical protein